MLWRYQGISAPMWSFIFDRIVADIGEAGGVVDLGGMPEAGIEPESCCAKDAIKDHAGRLWSEPRADADKAEHQREEGQDKDVP